MKFLSLSSTLLLFTTVLFITPTYIYAQQTDFAKLFEGEAYQTACEKYGNKFCYSPLEVVHQSETSMIVGIREGAMALIGNELDILTKAGYKVQSFVPDVGDNTFKYEQWIYLVK